MRELRQKTLEGTEAKDSGLGAVESTGTNKAGCWVPVEPSPDGRALTRLPEQCGSTVCLVTPNSRPGDGNTGD